MSETTVRHNSEDSCRDISRQAMEVLLDLITPYYKSFPEPGQRPEFKKSLTGEEIRNLLSGVHDVIAEILIEAEGE